MDDEYPEATPEQKLNIANYFIMLSPTGECEEVLSDVSQLVGDKSILTETAVNNMLKDYNQEHMIAAKAPSGDSVLVTSHGKVADDLFLDPSTGTVLRFDHRSREFKEETDQKQVLNDDINAYRTAIASAVNSYLGTQYKKNKATCTVYGADDGKIVVCVSATNVNLSNFWSGGWRTTYTLNVKTKGKTEMTGGTKINVHYFEDGNVQLHAARDATSSVDVSDPEGTGAAVAKAIGSLETEFQANMEEMYVDMHRTTFKRMRRILPLNRQPMNWNTFAHSLASEIGK
jgi:capping protein alpha